MSSTTHYSPFKRAMQMDKAAEKESPKVDGRNFHITVRWLCVAISIATVDTIIVATALSSIATALNTTTTQAFWCGIILLFAQFVSQTIYGALAEAMGRKITALIGLGVFSAGSLLGALASNINVLIVAGMSPNPGNNTMCAIKVAKRHCFSDNGFRDRWYQYLSQRDHCKYRSAARAR